MSVSPFLTLHMALLSFVQPRPWHELLASPPISINSPVNIGLNNSTTFGKRLMQHEVKEIDTE